MIDPRPRYQIAPASDLVFAAPPRPAADHSTGLSRVTLVGRAVGAVHTGLALARIEPGGHVGMHLHSTEQSVYVLDGHPTLITEGHSHWLSADECGLLPVGVPHGYRNEADEPALLLEANSPVPRTSGPADTFWTGEPLPEGAGAEPDIRDPRTRTMFRLGPGQMDVDSVELGSVVSAPTVSGGMATALLAYSGIAVKMLVDQRLGAVLHSLFMVECEPGGSALPHDHPFEESYYILEGEVVATASDDEFSLRAGDVFWTGVGCIHALCNRSNEPARWLQAQAPQPPSNYSSRFNRDWDYLAERIGENT
jgi:quercetin dioxygenase-like cupin family protein